MKKNDLEYIFSNINSWINNVDNKVSIFIGIQTAVLSLIFLRTFDWFVSNFFSMTLTEMVVSFIGFLMLIVSLYYSLRGLFPSVKASDNNSGLMFFGEISNCSLEKYKKLIASANEKEYQDELVEQIHTNSLIASVKFSSYKRSVLFFVTGLIILVFIYLTT